MMHLSVAQAVDIWADLEAAIRGEHAFGGHIAEIYAYRLMPCSPALEHRLAGDGAERRTIVLQAASALHDLLTHFAAKRRARISIETREGRGWTYRELGPWVRECGEDHRWRVQVEPAEARA